MSWRNVVVWAGQEACFEALPVTLGWHAVNWEAGPKSFAVPFFWLFRCSKQAVSPKHSEYALCFHEAHHRVISRWISLAMTEWAALRIPLAKPLHRDTSHMAERSPPCSTSQEKEKSPPGLGPCHLTPMLRKLGLLWWWVEACLSGGRGPGPALSTHTD